MDNLILKTKPRSPTAKNATKFYITAFIRESEVIKYGLPPEWTDTDQSMSIFEWAAITGISHGAIRGRLLKAERDKKAGKPYNTPRQIVSLDQLTPKANVRKKRAVSHDEQDRRVNKVMRGWG